MADANLTAALLRERFHYNPTTGVFTRLVRTSNFCKLGPAGMATKRGNVAICVGGKKRAAHRLAWLYMTGEWPKHEIDHIDGNPLNNCFANLREATGAQNKQNQHRPHIDNVSGFLGVFRHGKNRAGQIRWRARIQLDGKSIHIGLFDSPEAAHAAYLDAKRRLHPFGNL